jgi:hypothetical protein
LEFELGIPRFKAEALAKRIEERYCQKTEVSEPKIQRLFEKQQQPEPETVSSYSVDCLSEKELEHFVCWLLVELGYELQPEKHSNDFGFEIVAIQTSEKVTIQAVRCPKNYNVTDAIVLSAEESKIKHGSNKSIVIATGYFTQQAIGSAQKANLELWDQDVLVQKIAEARKRADMKAKSRFPLYQGTLLHSLLRLQESKDFLLEPKTDGKYDLLLPGVKYPLLTFQAQEDTVTRCIFRIKYNEPVSESEGEALIICDDEGRRVNQDGMQAYALIIQYLEQFLE